MIGPATGPGIAALVELTLDELYEVEMACLAIRPECRPTALVSALRKVEAERTVQESQQVLEEA